MEKEERTEESSKRPGPKPQEFYRHFKGGLYQIIALAKDADTMEEQVVYQALYGSYGIWSRPLKEFMSLVDKSKYPDAQQIWRFERIRFSEQITAAQSIEATETEKKAEETDFVLDPLVEQFLDAESISEKLRILDALRPRVTDEMIDTMAIASGVEVAQNDVQSRLYDLKECLKTIDRYEQTRDRFR